MKRKTSRIVAVILTAALMFTLCACSDDGDTAAGQTASGADDKNAPVHTVTLDPNGGAWSDGSTDVREVEVREGHAVDFPSYMPQYEGNTLYGWYQSDGSPWPGARKIAGDLTLKAKWSVAEEEVTYDLTLTLGGEPVTMEYENGVYQFTVVSSIYGGYAQRSGKYTLYMDDLKAAMDADDGTVQRVLYHAGSNYVDSTGTIYAEFYNDGEFELYYDYVNGGIRTKYCMDTGYWTYVGYTAPFENTPIPVDESGMGYDSEHADWDTSLL